MSRFLRAALVGALTAAALVAPCPAGGQPAPPLGEDPKTRVDVLFAAYDRSDSPGCALGVFRDGRLVYARGYGMANLELGVANSPGTAFDIGSTAKQFAALSILLLQRDGKLSVDDDIRKYVPEISDYGSRITIRHLLTHTSGLRDYLELMDLEGIREEDLTTDRDALEVISRQKALNFPPGSEYLYSNSGFFLLSVIVRRASGKSLREFARERIFEPLGMTHTQYNDDHGRWIPNRATGYAPREGGGFSIAMSDFEQTGDGGILTTVEDLLRWDQNFYEPVVGDRSILAQMQTPGRLNDGKALEYAFGLRVGRERGLNVVNHGGAWVGYRAQLERFPDQRFSVACLCNLSTSNPSRLARKVAELYLGDLLTKPEVRPAVSKAWAPSASDLSRYAGPYRDSKLGTFAVLTAAGGRLSLRAQGEQVPLAPVEPNRFAPADGAITLEFATTPGAGGRPGFSILEEGEAPQQFQPIDPWKPSAADLAACAGSYAADEVRGVFRFVVEDGRLVLKHRTIPDTPWEPMLADTFTEGYRNVTFTRDGNGRVNGLKLDADRVRGLSFRKLPK
jgi:CubicO group peptidase (beta-lactamase class C family)